MNITQPEVSTPHPDVLSFIQPLSQVGIGEWISNALVVKWPCEVANTSGLVTDPEEYARVMSAFEEQKVESERQAQEAAKK